MYYILPAFYFNISKLLHLLQKLNRGKDRPTFGAYTMAH